MLSIQKLGAIGRTYRHLNRYRQILAVFLKYGFGDLVALLKIDQYIEAGLQIISKKRRERIIEKLTRAKRIRIAFEELGPTFIKFGQIASTRPDLIPMEFMEELAKLQDKVRPFSSSKAKEIICSELGAPIEEIFESFDDTPLASASIGQVHKATLKDGKEVVVKVQRPDIRKTIEVDLEIMLYLATLMEHNIREMELYRPVQIVEEFARTLAKELDYAIESTNMERFASQFSRDPTVYIPKVYRDMTTTRVITMEYIDGIKISDNEKLLASGMDLKRITIRGTDLCLKQVFNNGFFHADPHPGNLFVLPRDVICMVDFGMVGSVDRQTREIFVDLIDSIVNRNPVEATQVILKLTTWDKEPETRLLERELSDFMGKHLYKPLKEIEIGRLLQNLLEILTKYRLRIPPDIFLMIKALTTVEGVARKLNPDFDMVSAAAPFIAHVKIARFYPERVAYEFFILASDLRQFLKQLPKDVLDITRMIKQEKLTIKMENKGLEDSLATQNKISNRLSFSIIIAALLIGSALIVISATPPIVYGISLIGLIGFIAASIMGIWLLVAIFKKGL